MTLPHSTWPKSTSGSTRLSLEFQYGYWADAYETGGRQVVEVSGFVVVQR
ncbi:hypothetical protein RCH06_003314 [Polaromonas sp. CG_9.5]|nr:hypothetical protein [Polaromonas sp. CG_9.5]